ncbi:MAG TPA: D-glycero-beta-D-manno-heptose 1-phosphate adenylyltransferase [Thermodesulfobacteriota bacterium]|nr:D-glycero-beta-D-manno-heptose 1-phosphate adenylyltransferase [Thermodesulfobacteriota bacterium]
MKEKIKKREELKKILIAHQKAGKKIVFTNGCYDLIHVGHVRYLKEAKSHGDFLVVAVNSDSSVRKLKGEKRPLIPEQERAEVLSALSCVDYLVIFDEVDPHKIISYLKPDVLVKGGDWTVDTIIGRDVVEAAGGKVISLPYIEGDFSSTSKIIETIVERYGK